MKRYVILSCVILLAACSGKRTDSQYHIDLKDPAKPVLYCTADAYRQNRILKSEPSSFAALFMLLDGKTSPITVGTKMVLKHDTFFVSPVTPLGDNLAFEWQIYTDGDTIRKRFETKSHVAPREIPRIVSIYPVNTVLPSNILLFHLFFSKPMQQDAQAYRYVHIIDENGTNIPFAWRQKASWADSGKQLILMIHPGRIKRGINYAPESASLFAPGKRYTLQTDSGLLALDGGIPAQTYSKTIRAQKADRQSPGFKPHEQSRAPQINSRQALPIAFTEPMDYGSVGIGLYIINEHGQAIKGNFRLQNDSLCLFSPEHAWQAGTYRLLYNEYLADLASNHVSRLFEVGSISDIHKQEQVAFRFSPVR